jgi:hypothetical protein
MNSDRLSHFGKCWFALRELRGINIFKHGILTD